MAASLSTLEELPTDTIKAIISQARALLREALAGLFGAVHGPSSAPLSLNRAAAQ